MTRTVRITLAALMAAAIAPLALAAQATADTTAAPEARAVESSGQYADRTLLPGTIRIHTTYENGGFVALEDGTVWEIYLRDRPSTAEWREGDLLQLRTRPIALSAPTGSFEYELVNGADGTTAAVRFAGGENR